MVPNSFNQMLPLAGSGLETDKAHQKKSLNILQGLLLVFCGLSFLSVKLIQDIKLNDI